jgi:hypothetical protein
MNAEEVVAKATRATRRKCFVNRNKVMLFCVINQFWEVFDANIYQASLKAGHYPHRYIYKTTV